MSEPPVLPAVDPSHSELLGMKINRPPTQAVLTCSKKYRGYAPSMGAAPNQSKTLAGKAKPYRTSGGKAATKRDVRPRPDLQFTFTAVSSITNDVCSELSSVPRK